MRLKDYLFGIPVTLKSPLPKAEVARRINAGAASACNPFASGVTGWVWGGRIRLSWNAPLFKGFAALSGKISEDGPGSVIRGSFGAPVSALVSYVLLYGFIAYSASAVFTDFANAGFPAAFMVLLLTLIPVMRFKAFNRFADSDLESILLFLECEAEATPPD